MAAGDRRPNARPGRSGAAPGGAPQPALARRSAAGNAGRAAEWRGPGPPEV